jgi:hypothetical protein
MADETNNITFNNHPQPYINSCGRKVLKYITPDTIVLDFTIYYDL